MSAIAPCRGCGRVPKFVGAQGVYHDKSTGRAYSHLVCDRCCAVTKSGERGAQRISDAVERSFQRDRIMRVMATEPAGNT